MKNSSKGFTIIELMIATAVFAVVLVLTSSALLQIGRIYYKGVTSARTQEAARSIMDDITQSIQFQGAEPQLAGTKLWSGYAGGNLEVTTFCIGPNRYNYVLDMQQNEKQATNVTATVRTSRHVLVKDTYSGACDPSASVDIGASASLPAGAHEQMTPLMRLDKLTIERYAPGTDNILWKVRVRIIAGDQDLIDTTGSEKTCKSGAKGSQFCAVSDLTTTVALRQR